MFSFRIQIVLATAGVDFESLSLRLCKSEFTMMSISISLPKEQTCS